MSIRILPDSEIKQAANSFQAPPLLFANPKNLYQRRAERLRKLAENQPHFADYLHFVARIAEAQSRVLVTYPLPPVPLLNKENLSEQFLATQPLNREKWQRDSIWREFLTALLGEIKPYANEQTLQTIDRLEKASTTELEEMADSLLAQEFVRVGSDKALFIWAALSLYWCQLTQQIPHGGNAENDDDLHICPVCGSPPVSGVIHFGATQGLRYLHCSLCESEWNLVRAKCSNCNGTQHIDYWSIDNELAAVRAESCGDCHSYLKMMYQDKDPYVEAVADDLANLFLDVEMEEKGFARSGLNPFMFPGEEA